MTLVAEYGLEPSPRFTYDDDGVVNGFVYCKGTPEHVLAPFQEGVRFERAAKVERESEWLSYVLQADGIWRE